MTFIRLTQVLPKGEESVPINLDNVSHMGSTAPGVYIGNSWLRFIDGDTIFVKELVDEIWKRIGQVK